jgi:hypothetical protein
MTWRKTTGIGAKWVRPLACDKIYIHRCAPGKQAQLSDNRRYVADLIGRWGCDPALASDNAATAVSCLCPAATASLGFEVPRPRLLMVVVMMVPVPVMTMMPPPTMRPWPAFAPIPHMMGAEIRERIAPAIVAVSPGLQSPRPGVVRPRQSAEWILGRVCLRLRYQRRRRRGDERQGSRGN